jgi:hypothetical protein
MGDWFDIKLKIDSGDHPARRVHQHELDHLRREQLIAVGEDGNEFVTEVKDEPRSEGDGAANAAGSPPPAGDGSRTETPKDGTARTAAPKTTKE